MRSTTENGNGTLVSTKIRATIPSRDQQPYLVREVGSFDCLGEVPSPGSAPLSTCLELKHIGQTDQAVAAMGQVLGGQLTRVNEADDERSRKV